MTFMRRILFTLKTRASVVFFFSVLGMAAGSRCEINAAEVSRPGLSKAIGALSPSVLSSGQRKEAASMIERDLRRRRDAANEQNRAQWRAIKNRKQWEAFRDARLDRLRKSLGAFPAPPAKLNSPRTLGWRPS